MATLPVELILDDVKRTLESHRSLVIQAPPGAGKTTLVAPGLLGAGWLGSRTILLLEPRRLATRAAARFMAAQRLERVGDTIGYRIRGESRVGPKTQIEVITEGVLVRRIQRDPTLENVGAILFDEFHERSLDADLSLALALRTRTLVREDLRLVVMSATLDGQTVARLLGDAPLLTSEGRVFPVDTRHVSPRPGAGIEALVASTVKTALDRDAGDILVFLPGAAEIHRVADVLSETAGERNAAIHPLFGSMQQSDQDAALVPDTRSRRKIVLATSIAETSLTIDGIGVVIDSGLSRVPRFSARTGMSRLETVRVSRASADQRRGRAGRLGPGVCYRLWSEHENHHLAAASPPEIANADLTPLALNLAAAGVNDPLELSWIDSPASGAFSSARELLEELGAVDANGRITRHGIAMSDLPVHPRLAHMLVRANELGAGRLGAQLAALLEERDVLRFSDGPSDPDLRLRLDVINGRASPPGATVDRDVVRRVRTEADRLASHLSGSRADASSDIEGLLLALAYPDRIGQQRLGARGRYLLRNGRGAEVDRASSLASAPYIVAADLDDRRPDSHVFLAAEVASEDIEMEFAEQIEPSHSAELDEDTRRVRVRRRERLGAIVLREAAVADLDPEIVRRTLLDAVARRGLRLLDWSDAAVRLRQRLAFVALHDPAWPDVSDVALITRLDEWLGPALGDATGLAGIDIAQALTNLLDWRQRKALDDLAPAHIEVPSGSRIAIDYSDSSAPALPVRIQEVFGWTESPRLMNGRVVLTVHLLSPARRPVQITRDLRGFWATSYLDVRKDLRGRYPKHEWPEDPLTATPTKRAKPRR